MENKKTPVYISLSQIKPDTAGIYTMGSIIDYNASFINKNNGMMQKIKI